MIDEKTAINGVKFQEFHKYRLSRFVSFANQKGTNFDKFEKWKNAIDWWRLQENNEQRLAQSIDYAHGLELDDFGDDVNLPRNGLSDDKYRFLIKSRRLSANSKGTFPDIIHIAANLLGCNPTDVQISNDRKWVNGKLVGEENTINIDSIDITKINTPDFIPILADELQNASLASTKIRQVGFYDKIPFTLHIGAGLAIAESLVINVPDEQHIKRTLSYQMQLGAGLVITERLLVDGKNHANVDEFMRSDIYLAANTSISKDINI